ncbi:MAG TPA: glycosyltransferase family 39 protein, partial [Vicinamibacteria bacterium]|nr:glycosyltransferase family 39 protein [Vicinamibacteria bacterium]
PLYYLALQGWLALVGDGPAALRALSVLVGLLVVPLAFALVREAERLDADDRGPAAALLAASMIAIHATQVLQSRNARMYALGTVLATGSAWLVLRAHRATARRWAWWTLWGLVAAAAVGTHYYLAFTVATQAIWAIGVAPTRRRLQDLLRASLVALATFAPWAPVLWRQARQVQAAYWIPPVGLWALVDGVARWALGIDAGRAATLAAILVAASLVAAARAGRAGRFFAAQAAAPWVLGLVVSVISGRPILLERYMLFAQVSLLCAWAVTATGISPRALRTGAAVAAALLILAAGLAVTLSRVPADPPALALAARALRRQAEAGDLVVVESPRVLNKLRYYARQQGADNVRVRAALPERIPLSPYVSHVVSLADDEAVAADAVFAAGADTVWIGRESTSPPAPAPAGWTVTFARIFEGGEDTRFALARYQRAEAPPASTAR